MSEASATGAADAAAAHPVTVVVPVYGDLESLTRCVDSLIEHLDQSVHSVLLVNDVGPDADAIEAALLAQIAGQRAFRYERNPRNLGFVGNCNRAVFELDTSDNDVLLLNSDALVTAGFLDELLAVLYADDSNGAVCARSNNATIASLPWAQRFGAERTIERTAQVHAALRDELPASSVSPVAMGFCLLTRRELIRRFGLFDEIFAPGYGEENDYCLRIGAAGFRSLIAHRSLVFHQGGRSFTGARREALRSAHEKTLVERYPHYSEAVQHYLRVIRDPADVFADALVPADERVKALFDLGDATITPPLPDARIAAVLRAAEGLSDAVDLTVAVAPGAVRSLASAFPGLRVIRSDAVNGIWDLGVGWPSTDPHQLHRLGYTCLRTLTPDQLGGELSSTGAETGPAALESALLAAGRSPVDLAERRAQWDAVVSSPGYLSQPSRPYEAWYLRAARRAERTAPRASGFAKALVRKALGREAG